MQLGVISHLSCFDVYCWVGLLLVYIVTYHIHQARKAITYSAGPK